MAISETERLKVWVRAGGRCVVCKDYLLEGDLTALELPLGEGAHIVGEKDSVRSPRGKSDLPVDQRNSADNIMLACPTCHTEADKLLATGVLGEELLRRVKRDHEDQIKHQTGLTKARRTVVVRVFGHVRGATVSLENAAAAEAVIRSADRFPLFLPAYDRQGIEVDLRDIDGEDDDVATYYRLASARIDREIRGRLREGIAEKHAEHVSVFALARLPLLVYLGAALDDAVATEVYQRHRATESWCWPDGSATVSFSIHMEHEGLTQSDDAVLITNLSGTTPTSEIPAGLVAAPVFVLAPDGVAPAEDLISSRETLGNFESTVRDFFTGLEATHKHVRRLHVFGAMPLSAAITLGRSLKAPDLRPQAVLYDRTESGYTEALTV